MSKRVPILALLLAFAATTLGAATAVPPKPDPDDGRLVEYEVTLRQMPATDSVGVLQRVAAAHHGMVTRVDVDGRRAYVSLPANRGAGLKDDPLVAATPSTAPSSSRRIDHLKPVTMTTVLRDSGTYGYDGAGNITNIGGDAFTYDAVNRLTDATIHVQVGTQSLANKQSYTYDAFGNRLSGSLLGHQCAAGLDCAIVVTTESATNRIKKTTTLAKADEDVGYDAAGDVTYFAGTTFEYDALGSMVSRDDGDGARFVYDANDERVGSLNVRQRNWKWTLRDVAGRQLREYTAPADAAQKWTANNWTWTRDHIYRGDQVLASVTPSQTGELTQYLHLDHLGTPRLITQNGRPVAIKTYYPFGAEASAPVESPEENHKFTGHESDDVNNGVFATDYMHARYYNATAGRFLSMDPALDIEKTIPNPQMWNRYAYVRNNPVTLTDPTGKCEIWMCPGPLDLINHQAVVRAVLDTLASSSIGKIARGVDSRDTQMALEGQAQLNSELVIGISVAMMSPGEESPSVSTTEQGERWLFQSSTLLESAIKPFNKELSVAGRALTKHPQVLGFANNVELQVELRSTAAINEAGSRAVTNILNNGVTTVINHPRYGQIIQVQIPGGFGARWNAVTKEFIGFISP